MPNAAWPELPPHADWKATCDTLHLWTQIVGKVRLAHTPWLNHGWHVPLYVTARGLGTSPIPHGDALFEMRFDFVDHVLLIEKSDGDRRMIALAPRPVAEFHAGVMQALADAGLATTIHPMPSEIPDALPLDTDRVHRSYDPASANAFWRALVQAHRVFSRFRTGFLGKSSPVHFFWGSFDLAVTRFSGRTAPPHRGVVPNLPRAVLQEAYSHEVSSAGFWPGGGTVPGATFYAYAYPEPPGYRERPVPAPATYDTTLGEFVLPWEAVRTADDPEALLLEFLRATYAAAADAGGWDRASLECAEGRPGVPRPV
jgi:hypothetical protein